MQTIDDLLADDSKKESDTEQELDRKISSIKQKKIEEQTNLEASSLGLSYIDLKGFPILAEALLFIPIEQSKSLQVVCFGLFDRDVKIGTTSPQNPQLKKLIDDIENNKDKKVELFLISEESLGYAIDLYENLPKIEEKIGDIDISEESINKYKLGDFTFDKVSDFVKKADTTEVINIIISIAIQFDASDIHIEAQKDGVHIRLRIDGVLILVSTLDLNSWSKIISRIKLISGLKINILTKPQDGRFTIHLQNEDIDVRVSTIPTNFGESVVMRLLRSSASNIDFEQLGIRGKSYIDLKRQMERPNGMIISTGPTGSGKTTTLYAILKKLNSPENKIITLEDPIEYRLEGINQSQIKSEKDYSFAQGLRSILRQDPDIVMVGEIRDLETAETAMNAALTGHLVISTLHTNSASGAIPRFLAMGVKSFLLTPALNAIVGQRLVRKICEHCKEEVALDNDTMTKILNILNKIPENSGSKLDQTELNNLKFYKGKGCEKCHGLGYKGRIGIFEVLTMTAEIEKKILENQVSEYIIEELAEKAGMVTMAQDGLLKAKDGITSIEEVFNVAE